MLFSPLLRAATALSFLVIFSVGFNASADESLLNPGCGVISQDQLSQLLSNADYRDLIVEASYDAKTCSTAIGLLKSADVVNLAILPAMVVLKTPGVREELAAQLTELGLTLANPPVLAITFAATTGYVIVYLVLKNTAEECAKEQIQQQIKQEVEERFQLQLSKQIPIQTN
jgi:hypothetical protein